VIQPEPGGLTAQNIEPEPCEGIGTPSNNPSPTPDPVCIIDAFYVDPFRAPITGNPPEPQLQYSNVYNYEIDERFIDHLGVVWYHIARAVLDGDSSNPITLDAWIPASPSIVFLGGTACNEGTGLRYATRYLISGHPWDSFTGTFARWPIDTSFMCDAATLPKEIHGLAYASGAQGTMEFHNGIDLFVPDVEEPSQPPAVNVYAIDEGIVVGIGINEDSNRTHAAWGSSQQYYGDTEQPGYSVIVRHGHLYVVYGHLNSIPDDIWVGQDVSPGTILGTLGDYNTRHLHIEVRSYGESIEATIPATFSLIEETGILPVGIPANQIVAPFTYDLTQLLPDPPGYDAASNGGRSFQQQVSNLTVTGANASVDIAFAPDCNLTYWTADPAQSAVEVVAGTNYRGFDAFPQQSGSRPLPSPLTQTEQP
jgi:murein DD-endopeptidase MepM/ murein hydrolase activator NlpD